VRFLLTGPREPKSNPASAVTKSIRLFSDVSQRTSFRFKTCQSLDAVPLSYERRNIHSMNIDVITPLVAGYSRKHFLSRSTSLNAPSIRRLMHNLLNSPKALPCLGSSWPTPGIQALYSFESFQQSFARGKDSLARPKPWGR